MGIVDMDTAMSRTNASDPWETGKAFPIQVRLRIDKTFLWFHFECWQFVQQLLLKAGDCWPTRPPEASWPCATFGVRNKHQDVPVVALCSWYHFIREHTSHLWCGMVFCLCSSYWLINKTLRPIEQQDRWVQEMKSILWNTGRGIHHVGCLRSNTILSITR